jgi:siroheme synthase-like protein
LLVVGGGYETDTRIRHAISFDWREIHVVARELTPSMRAFARADLRVSLHERTCTEQDVTYADFVLEDCGDPVLARRIADWCERHQKPLNACDKPDLCDAFYMSLAPIGPMIVGISSGGDAPAVSAALRRWLEANLSPGWAMAARALSELRRSLPSGQSRMDVLRNIARHPSFEDLVVRNDEAGLRALIEDELRRLSA